MVLDVSTYRVHLDDTTFEVDARNVQQAVSRAVARLRAAKGRPPKIKNIFVELVA